MPPLALIPQPQRWWRGTGTLTLPALGKSCSPAPWSRIRKHLGTTLPQFSHTRSRDADLVIKRDTSLSAQAYTLTITPESIAIQASSEEGAFYAVATLAQLLSQCPANTLPTLRISDQPDILIRGAYLDVTRGRVPTLSSLKHTIRTLALHKINQIQLYIEHAFQFEHHPSIGRKASPLSPSDITELDAWCTEHFIELVPSLASFGHMAPILRLPPYQHLAEDLGKQSYQRPGTTHSAHRRGWTLSPAHAESYDFIQSLYDDFLPCFTSKKFNVCCDETYDLGDGQSFELCKSRGRGRVYMDHVLKLRTAAAQHKKHIMFWTDVIRQYPEQLSRTPRNATLLDWGYEHNTPYQRIKQYTEAGHSVYGCPGTSSWVTLFPRIHEARHNILGYARAVKRFGADGLLITDWGDGGHYNFTEYSWHGLLAAAEAGWSTRGQSSFDTRFCTLFVGTHSPTFLNALIELGDICHTQFGAYYQSVWKHLFFEDPSHPLFSNPRDQAWTSKQGHISKQTLRITPALAERTVTRLTRIRDTMATAQQEASDPHGILPYWLFAIDTLIMSCDKLRIFGNRQTAKRPDKRRLAQEFENVSERFESLWMQRNRRSEIRITLARFRDQATALRNQ